MKKGDFVFVYGTLRRGERADLAKQAHNFSVDHIGRDRVNGRLYHLGSFPGVKLEPLAEFQSDKPIIVGEVFRIQNTSVTAILDAYEGYDSDAPERGLYNRRTVETEKGRTVWIYTYNHPVIEAQRIESGDWCKNKDMPLGRLLRE